jgi:hypothetical protein
MSDKKPEKQDTVVLGGGLVGQYAAYKLGAKLITLKPEKTIPYIFLHDAPMNRKMLDDLGVTYGTDVWKVGFMFKGQLYEVASQDMVNEYHTKCYGHPPNKPQFKKPYYDMLTPNYYEVRKKLEDLNKTVLYARIYHIDLIGHIVGYELPDKTLGLIKYKHLINTLPLPDLLHMAGVIESESYESRPIFYYKLPEWPKAYEGLGLDTVHVMDLKDERTRFVKGTAEPNTFFLETLEKDSKYGELSQVVKYGKIFNRGWHLEMRNNAIERLEKHGVLSVGRFARWQQHYDTQDALVHLSVFSSSIRPTKFRTVMTEMLHL